MTDQTFEDKVQKIASEMREAMRRDDPYYSDGEFLSDMSGYVRDLEKICARARPLPTLADMTDDERASCRWMQADIKPWGRAVIIDPDRNSGRAALIDRDDGLTYWDYYRVTPRPDLPCLEWPDDTPTGPDTLAVGTVIESADDPRIAALPVGTILLDRNEEATTQRYWGWSGAGYAPEEEGGAEFGPWTVLHIPKEEIS